MIVNYDGDALVGYCWTGIICQGEADAGKRKGRIFMLGVDPGYRNRGLGKRVLLAGLAHFKDKGIQVVEITVDNENEVAYALYQSVGFEIWTSSLWYEKLIN